MTLTHITKIDGKYYDLTKFNHPGGPTALWHSFGRDATVLFRSNHPFSDETTLNAILEKYEIPELLMTSFDINNRLLEKEEDVTQFRFNTPFAKDIKKGVSDYFRDQIDQKSIHNKHHNKHHNKQSILESIKATPSRWLQIGVLNVMRTLSFCQLMSGSFVGLFTYPLMTWLAGANTFHDACHFSLSSNQRINTIASYTVPIFCSPLTWYHHHNIGHHAYTNVPLKDPDLYHNPIFKRTIETTEYKKIYRYQHLTLIIEWVLSYIGLVIQPNIHVFCNGIYHDIIPAYYNNDAFFIETLHILLGITMSLLPFCVMDDVYKATLFSIFPYILHSLLFMLNSQITHIHTPCMVKDVHKGIDWYKHQVITATNHSIGSEIAFIFSGGLNYQIEHHLFPNINHCHLPKIQPIIKNICKKHKVHYKEFNNYYDAFLSYYSHIKLMSLKNE